MSFDLLSNRFTLRLAKQALYSELVGYEGETFLNESQINSLQIRRLIALCEYAWSNSSYYHERISPDDFIDEIPLTDLLSRLPLLTKDLVSEHYHSLVIKRSGQSNIKKSTGGSTGKPFHFELDYKSYIKREAVMWRGYAWSGYTYGQRALYLWGADAGINGFFKRLKDRLYHRFYNRKMLNSFALNEDNIADYLNAIDKYQPAIIVSYVNPILTLSRYMLEKNITVHVPKRILTGAEPLYEFQREIIQKAFQCKVMNTYGCREVMLIGSECDKQNGLHVNSDHLIVETLNDKGESVFDEEGDVVITDLFNYGMPLIRYKNGDRAVLSTNKCSCGNPFPLIKEIKGRKLDAIKAPNGSILPGEFFPHLLKDINTIKKFQVVQNCLDEVELSVVKTKEFQAEDLKYVETELDKYTAGSLKLKLHVVEDIPLTESGKHRVTVCNL